MGILVAYLQLRHKTMDDQQKLESTAVIDSFVLHTMIPLLILKRSRQYRNHTNTINVICEDVCLF